MTFAVAEKLKLPADAVTQTFGFFGRKGSGKTYAAGVLVESFLSAGAQVVVLDPVGNWYGLRLSKTGKSESPFHIPILGGERGDIPLETTGGVLVAKTIVETGTSAVLDVSHFRKAERKRFMADFAEELFHRKKTNRMPMHLVIEEAQLFAPQMAKGEERMLGAIEDLVRLGRNYGIGCSMISQRPQSINTEVRNQCEPLVVFQLVAFHEREAIGKWMQHMGVSAELEDLAKLKTGECFFWSPAWLERFVKTQFKEKLSFDASSTPTASSGKRNPAKLKSLDLGKLQSAMAETIQRAKEDDPKYLREVNRDLQQHIKQLEREAGKQTPVVDEQATERTVTAAVAERDRHWRGEVAKLDGARKVAIGKLAKINQLSALNGEATVEIAKPADVPAYTSRDFRQTAPQRVARQPVARQDQPTDSSDIPKGEVAILSALIQYPAGLERSQLTVLTGYKRSSRDSYIARLAQRGLVDTSCANAVLVTSDGQAALPDARPLPRGVALQEFWQGRLPRGEWEILERLIAVHPAAVNRDELSESTGKKRSSRDSYIARLKAKELVVVVRDGVRATDNLF